MVVELTATVVLGGFILIVENDHLIIEHGLAEGERIPLDDAIPKLNFILGAARINANT